jgi:hypothetical protein
MPYYGIEQPMKGVFRTLKSEGIEKSIVEMKKETMYIKRGQTN